MLGELAKFYNNIDPNVYNTDLEIFANIEKELLRQQNQIELIASENIVSRAVLMAQGSVLTNKYAEGYPSKRYYGGCEFVDHIENIAIDRAKQLFKCKYANVQPHSGSQANQAVFLALLQPSDYVLGMSLAAGGHLTHGAKPNISGKWFNAVQYGVNKEDNLINFDEVEALALKYKPKVIIAGGSAYPRSINFKKFREIADTINAYLWVDMAHFAGLVAADMHQSPFPYAHIVTTTTHKTLRGPRGGMILTNDEEIGKKIDSAVFPGLQGGPLMHVIAAKAIALKEALSNDFKIYAESVCKNSKILASSLKERGVDIVTDGTDTHLILVDLRSKSLTGNVAEKSLELSGLTCNKNSIPFDPEKPNITSGLRFGSPAATSRGLMESDFKLIGEYIADVIDALSKNKSNFENDIYKKVLAICNKFPIYRD